MAVSHPAPDPRYQRRDPALPRDWPVCACLLGCAAWPGLAAGADGAESTTREAYELAIKDACAAEPALALGGLIAIVPATPGLVWSDQGELLVVSWMNPKRYKNELADRNETAMDTDKLLWVTPARQVQDYCRAAIEVDPELGEKGLALRLTQYLGLPPFRNYGLFVELWVKPKDLFRACADPETSDDRCAPGPGPTPVDVKNIADYQAFYLGLRKTSCAGPYPRPWTGLGYTYHWGNATTRVGASELVLVPGAHYRVARTSRTRDYCSPPGPGK